MYRSVNPLFTTPEMAALFSGEATVGSMLAFEAALAAAEAAAGVIPADSATAIASACRLDQIDVEAMYRDAAVAGTPVIPLVQRLAALVEGVEGDGEAGRFVHWGATSQDTIDSGMVLQMCRGLDLLQDGLLAIGATCAALAREHRQTLMPGRTLLQHALPITFGLKAARWLALVTRQIDRLDEVRGRVAVVQFGGAAGTLAALGDRGVGVMALLAQELGLGVPDLPWHTERDRIAEAAACLGVVAGAMAKIAADLALLAQTEIGEVSEAAGAGKGGSSAMPQKQNPIDATLAVASARLAIGLVPIVMAGMVQEHERAAGNWQAEWAAIPDLFCYTAAAVDRVFLATRGLVVHPERMRANVDLTGGLIMSESLTVAVAARLGRPAAFRLVQAAGRQVTLTGISLRDAAMQSSAIRAALTAEALDQALDPARYLGSTDMFITNALEGFEAVRARPPTSLSTGV